MVIPRYSPIFGGAENQCRLLVRTLESREVVSVAFLLTKRIQAWLPRSESVDGVMVTRLGFPGISRWSEYAFYLHAAWELIRRRSRYDVIHCHATSIIGATVGLAGLIAGRPVVLKLSSNGELVTGLAGHGGPRAGSGSMTARLRRALARFTVRNATVVSLNEEGLEEVALAGAKAPLSIPNGVDRSHYRPLMPAARDAARAAEGLGPTDIVFVFTGRFVMSKGLDLLVRAIDELGDAEWAHWNGRVHFWLLGSSDLQSSAIFPGADTARPGRIRMRVVGQVSDALPYLQVADALVFPSRSEGMPNAVLEALAVGLPCVLSDISPHRELAVRNPAARCFMHVSGDASSLANALESCIAVLSGSTEAVRPAALAPDFDIQEVAAAYERLYLGVSTRGAELATSESARTADAPGAW